METAKEMIERITGKPVPDEAVSAYQYAGKIECYDAEGVCVFATIGAQELYDAHINSHGVQLIS